MRAERRNRASRARTRDAMTWVEHPAFTQRYPNAKGVVESVEVEQCWSCQCSPALRCYVWQNGDWRVRWYTANQRAAFSPCMRGGRARDLAKAKERALDAAEALLRGALKTLKAARVQR